MEMITVSGLRKSYGGRPAVQGVDLDVAEGEVFGILGPNGAGKTTTVEIIGGLRSRDAGTVQVAGLDPAAEDRRLRNLVGMQLQEARQPAKITAREALDLYRTFYPAPRSTDELLGRFGLSAQADTRFEHLSGGQQQRLSVALALVGNPRIAILDELTTGLDPAARHEIWQFLTDLVQDGVTILLVTHSMEEAQVLCDRVAIIAEGRVTALGSPAELSRAGGRSLITFTFDEGVPERLHGLRDLGSVVDVSIDGAQVSVRGTDDSAGQVLTWLTTRGVSFHGVRISAPSLDDAYLSLTRKEQDR